ncbi:F-box domain-containing protein, partial [Hirschfeldia incana]
MSSQTVSMRSRDLISTMPDEVLGKILSLLPTKLAASTSVLSKRWRNLLSLVDTLDFSDDTDNNNPGGFSDFVDATLSLLSNSDSIVKSFSLSCTHANSRLDGWIRTILERGFSELHLKTGSMHCIESQHFTSNALVQLTLYGLFCFDALPVPHPRGGVFFPNLKTLNLVSVLFSDDNVFECLISGCPLLDVLLLHYGDPSASNGLGLCSSIGVSNPSVKRLTVSYRFLAHLEAPDVEVFRTPSLVYFEYSCYATRRYLVDFKSLVEARLDLRSCREEERVVVFKEDGSDGEEVDFMEYNNDNGDDDDIEDEDDSEAILDLESSEQDSDEDDNDSGSDDDDDDDDVPDVTDLVAGISNVKTLRLSSYSLEVFYLYCKSMPVFHNLRTLSFESDKERGWQVLPLLLNNSPNLETLAIKGLVHKVTDRCGDACVCIAKKKKKKMEEEAEICCLSACQVKVLNISGYGGTRRELKQMRHFLGNLKCLYTVKVGVKAKKHGEDDNGNNNYQRITSALTKLPIASSNCQIHFLCFLSYKENYFE